MKYKYLIIGACLGLGYLSDASALGWGGNLYAAALSGDRRAIENYLNRGYSIDATDFHGQTALCQAYYERKWNAYHLLLEYGANPNAPCMIEQPVKENNFMGVRGGTALGGLVLAGGVVVAMSGGGSSSKSDTQVTDGDTPDNPDNPDTHQCQYLHNHL